eukprot:1161154-Pelagomonas_calceolata.AAC.4
MSMTQPPSRWSCVMREIIPPLHRPLGTCWSNFNGGNCRSNSIAIERCHRVRVHHGAHCVLLFQGSCHTNVDAIKAAWMGANDSAVFISDQPWCVPPY